MTMTTPQKWLLGCGIGCAVLVLAVIGLVTGTALYVRGRFEPLQQASDSVKTIVAAHGAPESFVPAPDGTITANRMEAFLGVREGLRDARQRLDAALASFDIERLNRGEHSFGAVFGLLRDVGNVIVPVGEYVGQRNKALMERSMGLGEYAYIYTISYHSWLGHQPGDGPALLQALQTYEGTTSESEGLSPERVQRQYRRLMMRWLRNQLDAIREAEQTKWRTTLQTEIDRLDNNPEAVAWRDHVPAPMRQCLEPFRARLSGTWHPATNFFELLTMSEAQQFRWNSGGNRAERGPE